MTWNPATIGPPFLDDDNLRVVNGVIERQEVAPPPPPDPDPDPEPPPPSPDPTDEIVVSSGESVTLTGTVITNDVRVEHGGTLTLQAPLDLVIADVPIDLTADPEQEGRGLRVMGGLRTLAPQKTAYARCTAGILQGATTATLDAAPVGWQPGDTLVLPHSAQRLRDTDPSQTEEVTLQSVSGQVVTFTPTVHAHPMGTRPELTPHVVNVSRDIVIRSENPDGTRGHVLFGHGCDIQIEGIEFRDLGRTDKRINLDPVTNPPGRYPLHFHKCGDVLGQWVKNCVFRHSNGWGMAVHATHNLLVQDSVGYDIFGSAFVCEDGSERNNVFERCGGVKIKHVGREKDNINVARSGDAFWQARSGNVCRDCFGADCGWSGHMTNGYAAASDMTFDASVIERFECYASPRIFYGNWQQGAGHEPLNQYARQFYDDCTGWNLSGKAVDIYHTNRNTFRRLRLLNDPAATNRMPNDNRNLTVRVCIGVFANATYQNGGLEFEDCEIEGYVMGIMLPQNVMHDHYVKITGGRLANYVNIVGTLSKFFDRDAVIENVNFDGDGGVNRPSRWHLSQISLAQSHLDVWMQTYEPLTHRSDVLMVGYESNPLRVFHKEWPTPPCTDERPLIHGFTCEEN